jgi:hypothetical protein
MTHTKMECSMSDQPSGADAPKRWFVEMSDKTTRTVEARGFRIEGSGALVFVLPAACVAAFAHGTWSTIMEAEQ